MDDCESLLALEINVLRMRGVWPNMETTLDVTQETPNWTWPQNSMGLSLFFFLLYMTQISTERNVMFYGNVFWSAWQSCCVCLSTICISSFLKENGLALALQLHPAEACWLKRLKINKPRVYTHWALQGERAVEDQKLGLGQPTQIHHL